MIQVERVRAFVGAQKGHSLDVIVGHLAWLRHLSSTSQLAWLCTVALHSGTRASDFCGGIFAFASVHGVRLSLEGRFICIGSHPSLLAQFPVQVVSCESLEQIQRPWPL